jgi:outer membrane protein
MACLSLATHSFALDILTAIELAEQNDANYRARVQESLAKNADGWSLVAAMGPRLMVSGKMMRSRLDYSPEEIADLEERHLGFNDQGANITLDQPLLDMEKIYRARRGGCEMDIAALEQEKAREELMVLVVERYFHILSVQDSLELANAKLKLLKRQLEMAGEGHDLGLGDQADLYDIQARFDTTRAVAALEEGKLVDARAALEELMGQPIVESLAGIEGDRVFELPENEFEHWLQRAKKHNVDIRLSSLHSEAARLDGKIGAGRFLPALSFFAEYDSASPDNDISGYGWDRERTDYGLKLQMELLSGGRDLADFAAREHRYKASRQQIVAVRRAVLRKTEASWNRLERLLEATLAYKKAVDANERSLTIKEANYQEGLQTMLDVLNVQRDFFVVSNRYRSARYDYMTSLIQFRQLVGDLETVKVDLKVVAGL